MRAVRPLVDKKEFETAKRVRAEISAAFSYAIAHEHTDYDPAQSVVEQIPAPKTKHGLAITEPKEVGKLLRDIDNYQGSFIVTCAFKLSPLLFQRPGEIRAMEWKDIYSARSKYRLPITLKYCKNTPN